MLRRWGAVAAALFFICPAFAQVHGIVTDTAGSPLPFASVFVTGTSQGTTANEAGEYELFPERGQVSLTFNFVGFEPLEKTIHYTGKPTRVDVQLHEASLTLPDVVVHANKEDPAYRIVRQAIKKRRYYKNLVPAYSCRAYVKGVQKIEDAPKALFGNEVGDLGGILDTAGQGFLYFAESLSKLYYRAPGHYKEIIQSVKVSGDDQGFGFNTATIMTLSLYQKTIDIGRAIVSPIAPNAMNYYRYKLIGTTYQKNGDVINKIQITPRHPSDPAFSGFIYIRDEYWDLYGTDVWLTGKNIKQPILDTLRLRQNFITVRQPDVRLLQSQYLNFRIRLFGFTVGGYFIGSVSDYHLGEDKNVRWNQDLYVVNEDAIKKDVSYWDSIRPIPLSRQEAADYIKKDSLSKVWRSKAFLDSIDRKTNRLTLLNLLTGYTYRQRYHRREFYVRSPLEDILFNTVQGTVYGTTLGFIKTSSRDKKLFEQSVSVSYGLAEKKWRFSAATDILLNAKDNSFLSLSAGQEVRQFNTAAPLSPVVNDFYCTFLKINHLRLFDSRFAQVQWRTAPGHGLAFKIQTRFAERRPLVNHSGYSWLHKERIYDTNHPLDPRDTTPAFATHRAWVSTLLMSWTPAMKYLNYPDERIEAGSKWPRFFVDYRWAVPLASSVAYHRLAAGLQKREVPAGVAGRMDFYLRGGMFLSKDSLAFMDYFHFEGNQTVFTRSRTFAFHGLPYYEYSTTEPFAEAHWRHRLKGFVLDKIPLLRRLGWNEVYGISTLQVRGKSNYSELFAGFENIGIKAFRIFHVHVFSTFVNGRYRRTGVTFGASLTP